MKDCVGTTVTWVKATYVSTAKSDSHTRWVRGTAPTGDASVLADDVTVTQDAWVQTIPASTVPQAAVSDTVIRSQSGRILQNTLTDGPRWRPQNIRMMRRAGW